MRGAGGALLGAGAAGRLSGFHMYRESIERGSEGARRSERGREAERHCIRRHTDWCKQVGRHRASARGSAADSHCLLASQPPTATAPSWLPGRSAGQRCDSGPAAQRQRPSNVGVGSPLAPPPQLGSAQRLSGRGAGGEASSRPQPQPALAEAAGQPGVQEA
jgi:hypothetical protein